MPYLTLVDSTAERDFTQHAEVQERNGRVARGMPVYLKTSLLTKNLSFGIVD